MAHKYNIGDIFMRQYSGGNATYYMIIELIDDPITPIYEVLILDNGDDDIIIEGYLNMCKKVA